MQVLRDNGRGHGWPNRRSLWWKANVILCFVFLFVISTKAKGISSNESRKHKHRVNLPRKIPDHSNCRVSLPYYNSTLLGGIASGTFTKIGRVESAKMCGMLCCKDNTCDVAFSVDDTCYNVQCYSYKLCRRKVAGPSKHHTTVMYSQRKDGSLRLSSEKQKKTLSHSKKHNVFKKNQGISKWDRNATHNMNKTMYKTSVVASENSNIKSKFNLSSYSGNEVAANITRQKTHKQKSENEISVGKGSVDIGEIQNASLVEGITKVSKLNGKTHSLILAKNKSDTTEHDSMVKSLQQQFSQDNINTSSNNSKIDFQNVLPMHKKFSSAVQYPSSTILAVGNNSKSFRGRDTNQNNTKLKKMADKKRNKTLYTSDSALEHKPNQTVKTNHTEISVHVPIGKTNKTSVSASFNETHFWKDNVSLRKTSLLAVNENETSQMISNKENKNLKTKNLTLALKQVNEEDKTISLSSVESLENRNGKSYANEGLLGVQFESNDSSCLAKEILHNVTLRNGLQAGEFTDYGKVKDVETCIRLCCEEKACDLSLMLQRKCYTLHCHSNTSCELIPAHSSKLDPVVAFVSRSLTDKTKAKRNRPLHKSKITLQSVQTFLRDPKCRYKDIKHGVTLPNGLKAAKFKVRGVISDMKICIGLCCSDPGCNAAFLAAPYCYSVTCSNKTLCTPVKAHASTPMTSQLALIDRGDYVDEETQKRQSIPETTGGILSPDVKYTVVFNITNVVFTKQLQDFESLEYLNFAEKIQIGVSTLFKVSQLSGFKKCEVISFRPSPLIVNMALTVEGGTNVKEVLKTFLQAIEEQKLVSSIDGNVDTYKLDPLGFEFITPNNTKLICQAGHDYDVTWDITIFGEENKQHCPRGATGQVKRQCLGQLRSNATWDIPNFSECVSPEYKNLHDKSKQFADGAKQKIPIADLKGKTGTSPMEILNRLQKLTLQDSFREEIMKANQQALEIGRRKSKVLHSKSVDTKTKIEENTSRNEANISESFLNNRANDGTIENNKLTKTNSFHIKKLLKDVQINYPINGRHQISKPKIQKSMSPLPNDIANNQRLNSNIGKQLHHIGLKEDGQTEQSIGEVLKPQEKVIVSSSHFPKHAAATAEENLPLTDQTNVQGESSVSSRIQPRVYEKPIAPWKGGSLAQSKYSTKFGRPGVSLQSPNVRNGFPGTMINLHLPLHSTQGSPENRQYNKPSQNPYGVLKPNNPYIAQLHSPPRPIPPSNPGSSPLSPPLFPGFHNSYNTAWQNNNQPNRQNQYEHKVFNYNSVPSLMHPASSVYGNGLLGVDRKQWRMSRQIFDAKNSNESLERFKREIVNDDKVEDRDVVADDNDDDNVDNDNTEKYDNNRSTILNGNETMLKQENPDFEFFQGVDTFNNYNDTSSLNLRKIAHSSSLVNLKQRKKAKPIITLENVNNTRKRALRTGNQHPNDRTLIRNKRQNLMWYKSRLLPSSGNPFTQYKNVEARPQQVSPFLSHIGTSYNNDVQSPSTAAGAGTYDITYSPTLSTEANVPLGVVRPPYGFPQKGTPDRQLNDEPNTIGYKGPMVAKYKPRFSTSMKSPDTLGILRTTPSGPLSSQGSIPVNLVSQQAVQNVSSSIKPLIYKEKSKLRQFKTTNILTQQNNQRNDPRHNNEESSEITEVFDENKNATLFEHSSPHNTQNSFPEKLKFKPKPHPAALHSVKKNTTFKTFNKIASSNPETSISDLNKKLTAITENNGKPYLDSFPQNKTSFHEMDGVNAFGQLATAPSPFAPVLPKTRGSTHLAPMFGGDLLLAADILKYLSTFNELAKPVMTIGELTNFVNIGSHIMDINNQREWQNAEEHIARLRAKGMNVLEDTNAWDWDHSQALDSMETESTGPTVVLELVQSIESYATKASYRLLESKLKHPFITRNILLEIKILDASKLNPNQSIVFPNYNLPDIAKWSNKTDSLTISPAIFKSSNQMGTSNKIYLISSQYRTVADLLNQNNTADTGAAGHPVSRRTIMSSQMITTTVIPSPGKILEPPVRIVLTHNSENVDKLPQQCVFWKTPSKSGESGGWSGDGCKLVHSNLTHSVCECSHLTSFALLSSPSQTEAGFTRTMGPTPAPEQPEEESSVFNILLGLLFLLLLIFIVLLVVFFVWRKRKRRQQKDRDGLDGGSGTRPKARDRYRTEAGVQSPTTSPHDEDTVDKSEGTEFEAMIAARRKAVSRGRGEKRAQKTGEGSLMKEKAIIYSEYRQPYNFLAHVKPIPSPRTKHRLEAAERTARAEWRDAGAPSSDASENMSSPARPQPKPRRPRRLDH